MGKANGGRKIARPASGTRAAKNPIPATKGVHAKGIGGQGKGKTQSQGQGQQTQQTQQTETKNS